MRGKLVSLILMGGTRGLIPACAGKTTSFMGLAAAVGAHPRVCGENPPPSFLLNPSRGSSPRVRGKLRVRAARGGPTGLIPACAGKTGGGPAWGRRAPAHPRVCGENVSSSARIRAWKGSSPRVRGKRPRLPCRQRRRGLIPACAGKTTRSALTLLWKWAHPRVCGENFALIVFPYVY